LQDRFRKFGLSLQSVQARQRLIGAELARMWDSLVKEPVPDEILEVLAKLDEKDRKTDA
jgi:hypothetical protein